VLAGTNRCAYGAIVLARRLAAAALVAAILGQPHAHAAAAEPLDTMPDGAWLGSLIYNAEASFPAGAWAEAAASGLFDFVVSGGIVTEGTFEYTASGIGTLQTAIAALDFYGQGGVEGNADHPVLRADSMSVTGVAQSQGLEVPIEFTAGPGEMPPIPLEIFTVTCEQVTGDFTQPIAAAIAAVGGNANLFGRWVAVFNQDPALTPDTIGVLEVLIADAEKIANAAKAGQPIDPILLLDVLDRAEQLAASIPVNTACRNIQPQLSGTFALMVGVVIEDVIRAVLANPQGINLTTLQAVVAAGVRTGILSANAPAGSTAEALSIELQAGFETRLDAAIAQHPMDTASIQQIMLTATAMGWTSTADKAKAALTVAPLRSSRRVSAVVPNVPGIAVHTAGAGVGARPLLAWDPVDGAASYVVAVTVPAGGPLWAWSGVATDVPYGGGPAADPDTSGAQLAQPSTWFVAAVDAGGLVLAASVITEIAP
jgi:hypothetical protein